MFKSIHANVPVIAAPIAEHSRSFVSVFCFVLEKEMSSGYISMNRERGFLSMRKGKVVPCRVTEVRGIWRMRVTEVERSEDSHRDKTEQ